MGDVPDTRPGSQDAQQAPAIASGHSTMPHPTQSPTASGPPHERHDASSSNAFISQFDMTQSPANRQPSFSMDGMAAALPHPGYSIPYHLGAQLQHGLYPVVTAAMSAQLFQPAQYGVPGVSTPVPTYYPQQGVPMQQYYPVPMYHAHPPPRQPAQPRQNMVYAPGQMTPNIRPQAPHGPPPVQYHPPSAAYATPQVSPHVQRQNSSAPRKLADPRTAPPPVVTGSSGRGLAHSDGRALRQNTSTDGTDGVDGLQPVVRGPPRKPKQRGYAIWIGNLPPHADLMSLVNHVCREAPGLDSLFLISKSNCAFANFQDEQTCIAAQQKLHDSRFQTVRLVSRLRKSAVERSGIVSPAMDGPTSASSSAPASDGPVCDGDAEDAKRTSTPASSSGKSNAHSGSENMAGKDRYFILKSLTTDDLETSVRNGIWATQSHNEDILNTAFKTADSVYLIFSANKSGEYFGYARMTSPINEDPEAAIEFAPATQTSSSFNLPKSIPMDATQFAPKGRIIDDSARGTIFWELERDSEDSGDEEKTDGESVADGDADTDGMSPKSWGKPFTLEWMSTARVPFYRTRGLRNPWNANREVKIARDGTELEPNAGRRLTGLFNTIQSPGITPPGLARQGLGPTMGYHPAGHRRPYP